MSVVQMLVVKSCGVSGTAGGGGGGDGGVGNGAEWGWVGDCGVGMDPRGGGWGGSICGLLLWCFSVLFGPWR